MTPRSAAACSMPRRNGRVQAGLSRGASPQALPDPADGFYEWQRAGAAKQPMRIRLRGGAPFAMAGLYETWTSPAGERLSTCTILTTQPNELMAPIHDRMPVILRPEDEPLWLNRAIQDPAQLSICWCPYPSSELEAYPVSPIVGQVKNDVPACIEPLIL